MDEHVISVEELCERLQTSTDKVSALVGSRAGRVAAICVVARALRLAGSRALNLLYFSYTLCREAMRKTA